MSRRTEENDSVSLTSAVAANQALREQIAAETSAFLARGGKITVVPTCHTQPVDLELVNNNGLFADNGREAKRRGRPRRAGTVARRKDGDGGAV
jgi:hypothetical protein